MVPLDELKALVSGLRQLGYEFADLSQVPAKVHYDYTPPATETWMTWLSTTFWINVRKVRRWGLAFWNNITTPLSVLLGVDTTAHADSWEDGPYRGKMDPRCQVVLK